MPDELGNARVLIRAVTPRSIRESDIILLEVQLSRLEQKRDHSKLRVAELARRPGVDA